MACNWDVDRENIQPLKSGRKINDLHEALHHDKSQFKRKIDEFEIQLRSTSGEENLDTWFSYITWMEQHVARLTPSVIDLNKRCVAHFKGKKEFYQNEKLVHIWLSLAQQHDDADVMCEYLYDQDIGASLAMFYRDWALHCEISGKTKKAADILELGINRKAEPLSLLMNCRRQFDIRMAKKSTEEEEEESSSPTRKVLGSLKASKTGKVASDRVKGLDKTSGAITASLKKRTNSSPEKFNILRDRENICPYSHSSKQQIDQLPTDQTIQDENTKATSMLRGTKISGTGVASSLSANFSIFTEADVNSTSSSSSTRTNLMIQRKPLSVVKAKKDESYQQPFQSSSEQVNTNVVVCYNKAAVYMGATEVSFEEMKARLPKYISVKILSESGARLEDKKDNQESNLSVESLSCVTESRKRSFECSPAHSAKEKQLKGNLNKSFQMIVNEVCSNVEPEQGVESYNLTVCFDPTPQNEQCPNFEGNEFELTTNLKQLDFGRQTEEQTLPRDDLNMFHSTKKDAISSFSENNVSHDLSDLLKEKVDTFDSTIVSMRPGTAFPIYSDKTLQQSIKDDNASVKNKDNVLKPVKDTFTAPYSSKKITLLDDDDQRLARMKFLNDSMTEMQPQQFSNSEGIGFDATIDLKRPDFGHQSEEQTFPRDDLNMFHSTKKDAISFFSENNVSHGSSNLLKVKVDTFDSTIASMHPGTAFPIYSDETLQQPIKDDNASVKNKDKILKPVKDTFTAPYSLKKITLLDDDQRLERMKLLNDSMTENNGCYDNFEPEFKRVKNSTHFGNRNTDSHQEGNVKSSKSYNEFCLSSREPFNILSLCNDSFDMTLPSKPCYQSTEVIRKSEKAITTNVPKEKVDTFDSTIISMRPGTAFPIYSDKTLQQPIKDDNASVKNKDNVLKPVKDTFTAPYSSKKTTLLDDDDQRLARMKFLNNSVMDSSVTVNTEQAFATCNVSRMFDSSSSSFNVTETDFFSNKQDGRRSEGASNLSIIPKVSSGSLSKSSNFTMDQCHMPSKPCYQSTEVVRKSEKAITTNVPKEKVDTFDSTIVSMRPGTAFPIYSDKTLQQPLKDDNASVKNKDNILKPVKDTFTAPYSSKKTTLLDDDDQRLARMKFLNNSVMDSSVTVNTEQALRNVSQMFDSSSSSFNVTETDFFSNKQDGRRSEGASNLSIIPEVSSGCSSSKSSNFTMDECHVLTDIFDKRPLFVRSVDTVIADAVNYVKITGVLPKLQGATTEINLGPRHYRVSKCLVKESNSATYKAVNSSDQIVFLKIKRSDFEPSLWDFYITQHIHECISKSMGQNSIVHSCFMRHECFLRFEDVVCVESPLDGGETLREFVDLYRRHERIIDEPLVMLYAHEILRTVHLLHQFNIIHTNLKADNFMQKECDFSHGQPCALRCLILKDFEWAIDLSLIDDAENVLFTGYHDESSHHCPDIKSGAHWKYEVDYIDAAAIIHLLAFQTEMNCYKDPGTNVMKISQTVCSDWDASLWTELFSVLINASHECDLTALFNKFEERLSKPESIASLNKAVIQRNKLLIADD